jgi:hypothetical protein
MAPHTPTLRAHAPPWRFASLQSTAPTLPWPVVAYFFLSFRSS